MVLGETTSFFSGFDDEDDVVDDDNDGGGGCGAGVGEGATAVLDC